MLTRTIFISALWLGAGAAFASPEIQHWETDNGARVYFVEAREIPIVDVQVVFDAAGSRDGDKPGLAQLTNALLAQGAAGLSADRIAERFAELGAQFGNESLRDMASASLRTLSDPQIRGPALALVADILARPDLPADAFERVRNQMRVAVKMEKESPSAVATKAFYAGLYREHPYGQPPGGTEASLNSITRDDVASFHRRYYTARNAVVAIVGDLSRAEAEKVARTLMAALPPGQRPPPIPPAPATEQGVTRVIEYPSTQTHLKMGQPGVARTDADYYALYVGNHALGGNGLVSILADEVREKRGLSYSVYSRFQPMRAEGPFTIGLQTKNDQAETALEVARAALKRFIEEGPSEGELTAAKRNITGGFALRIDSNQKIVGYLALIGFYGLPLDYLQRFNDRIEAVTREQVRDAFQRRVHPDRLFTVLVGGAQDVMPAAARNDAAAHRVP
jgi:zinc protease